MIEASHVSQLVKATINQRERAMEKRESFSLKYRGRSGEHMYIVKLHSRSDVLYMEEREGKNHNKDKT